MELPRSRSTAVKLLMIKNKFLPGLGSRRILREGRATAGVDAPAKLNVSLKIVGRRIDGYHLLDSLVVPISIADRVTVSVDRSDPPSVSFQSAPDGAVPLGAENLCVRAALVYLQRTHSTGRVHITLRKSVPVGAGMGGGSSDAAATLRLLNALADRPVPRDDLSAWALELGADVPFFLIGGPARMQGIGEVLERVGVPLTIGPGIVVAFSGTPLETRHVYAKYDDSLTSRESVSRVRGLIVDNGSSRKWLENDLEAAACELLPSLRDLKRQLHGLGARDVAMTGSGSAIFGVWNCVEQAANAARSLDAMGIWARATSILDTLPDVAVRDADDDGRSPSW